jgi:hypothetical protein
MMFEVLAVAPIGTREQEVPRLLQFLSRAFFLEEPPSEQDFKKGGVCFLRTRSLAEAKAAALRLRTLGADFRIINPAGHLVAEGQGRWRALAQVSRSAPRAAPDAIATLANSGHRSRRPGGGQGGPPPGRGALR